MNILFVILFAAILHASWNAFIKNKGNGFAKMKCKERIAELEKIFDEIDYAAQITYD